MNKNSLKRIFSYVKPHAGYLVISMVCSVIYALCALFAPVPIGKAIDVMLGKANVDFAKLTEYISVIGGLTCGALIAGYGQSVANNRLAFLTVRDIRTDVIKKMQILPLSYFDNTPPGNVVSNMIADAEAVSDGFLLGFTQLFSGLVTVVGTLVMMIVINLPVAAVVALLTPLSLFTARFISKKTHEKFAKQGEIRAKQTSFIQETVTNQKALKAYCQEENVREKFVEINEELRKTALSATFFSSLPNPLTRFVNALVYASVALIGALCATGTIKFGSAITAGVLASLLSYAGQYSKPFNEISGVITELQSSIVGANRIFSLLSETEEPPCGNEKPENTAVSFENVSFSYTPARPLIKNLNLNVEEGKHVAIVGKTGSGKTTLINLLMRFYDANGGEIKIGNKEITSLSRKRLRDDFGMVLQESWIRNATVRENLTLGADISDEEMIKAAEICKADGFISRLKDGYDTVITDENLSQGERQLLCITRVMLSSPKALILDEATSAVDLRTEVNINAAFDMLMEGKTSFVVAHRLSTVKNADVILVMEDGDVVETGTHEELLKKGGVYASLYSQNG